MIGILIRKWTLGALLAAGVAIVAIVAFGCGEDVDGDSVLSPALTAAVDLEMSGDPLEKERQVDPAAPLAAWAARYPEPPEWADQAVRDVLSERFLKHVNNLPEQSRVTFEQSLEATIGHRPYGPRGLQKFRERYALQGTVWVRREPSTLKETAEIRAFKEDLYLALEKRSKERIDGIKQRFLKRISGGAMLSLSGTTMAFQTSRPECDEIRDQCIDEANEAAHSLES